MPGSNFMNGKNKLSEQPPQLCILLTGPGGTGKTHIVCAVNKVMSPYGCEHHIHYLAPTGSIAKISNGMTVHKGLGIAIQKKK